MKPTVARASAAVTAEILLQQLVSLFQHKLQQQKLIAVQPVHSVLVS